MCAFSLRLQFYPEEIVLGDTACSWTSSYPKLLIIEDLVCELVLSIGKRSIKIIVFIPKFY